MIFVEYQDSTKLFGGNCWRWCVGWISISLPSIEWSRDIFAGLHLHLYCVYDVIKMLPSWFGPRCWCQQKWQIIFLIYIWLIMWNCLIYLSLNMFWVIYCTVVWPNWCLSPKFLHNETAIWKKEFENFTYCSSYIYNMYMHGY